jgi:hypothetical protein
MTGRKIDMHKDKQGIQYSKMIKMERKIVEIGMATMKNPHSIDRSCSAQRSKTNRGRPELNKYCLRRQYLLVLGAGGLPMAPALSISLCMAC